MTSCIPTYEDQMQIVKLKYARRSATGKFEVFKYSKHVMYNFEKIYKEKYLE